MPVNQEMARDFDAAWDFQNYGRERDYQEAMLDAPEDFYPEDEAYPSEPPNACRVDPRYDECGFGGDDGRFDDDPNPYHGDYYEYGGEG